MSYTCQVCSCECDEGWCNDCNKTTPIVHKCEMESGRLKDIIFGENSWTATLYFNYCDECGENDI